MGVPIMCILLGLPIGWYIARRAIIHTQDLKQILSKVLQGAALTSAFTFLVMALLWGRCIVMLFDPTADLANFGIPAMTIQKALLPQEIPNIPGLDVAAFSRPAEFLGGDYFDFIDFSADTHGLVIADVAGHGVSASLQMAGLQALARAIIPTSHSPAEVVTHIHNLFRHNIRFTTFVTVFIGAFNPTSSSFTYCNAGHNPPLLLHSIHSQSISAIIPI